MGGHVMRMGTLSKTPFMPSAKGRVVFFECTAGKYSAEMVVEVLKGLRDGGFLYALHGPEDLRLNGQGRELSHVPEAYMAFLGDSGLDGRDGAQAGCQKDAFFPRKGQPQRYVIDSVHHAVLHPLMRETAHQSIWEAEGNC